MEPLIIFTDRGLYCPQAKVYIDPWKKVDRALVTHGHSDHARRGHGAYLCQEQSVGILKHRLGKINIQGIAYKKKIYIDGIEFSFYPAGHVYGSAQIKVSNTKQTWVVSGDYKLANDKIATPFVPVPCDHFITESTFGVPAFQWEDPKLVFNQINTWWQQNRENNRASILTAYSLGKAQRIIKNVDSNLGPIVCHSAIEQINELIRKEKVVALPKTELLEGQSNKLLSQSLILCPPGALKTEVLSRLDNPSLAIASGWMALRSARKNRNVERGFVLSDHADWNDLNRAVALSEANNIYVTHGYTSIYSKWLKHQGYKAAIVKTAYEGEGLEPIKLTALEE